MERRVEWRALFRLLEREIEAREDSDGADGLRCAFALLHWEIEGDSSGALRVLEDAGAECRLATELSCQILLEQGLPDQASERYEELASNLAEPEDQRAILAEAALHRLLWCGDAVGAAEICRRGAALVGGDRPIAELEVLASAVAGDLEAILAQARGGEASLSTLTLAGTALWDRSNRPVEAEELLRQAFYVDDEDLFILELLLEVQISCAEETARVEMIKKKVELLSGHEVRSPEALALYIDLARMESRAGRFEEAATLLNAFEQKPDEIEQTDTEASGITDPVLVNPLAWGKIMLLMARRELAVLTRDAGAAASAYLSLARVSKAPAMVRTYRTRAAQLLLMQDAESEVAEALLQKNIEESPGDFHSAGVLERVRIRRGRMRELCRQYEHQATAQPEMKGVLLRRAAMIAEAHLGDQAWSATLRKEGLAVASDPTGLADLQRLYRNMGSQVRLIEAYKLEADRQDPASASLIWGVIAAIHIQLGQDEEGERSARRALTLEEDNPVALALLAWIFQIKGLKDQLDELLQASVEKLASSTNRAAWYRQLAALHHDQPRAKGFLATAQQLLPEDPNTLTDLVTICEEHEQYDEACAWGEELAKALSGDPRREAEALLKVGSISLHRLGDPEQAITALARAIELVPGFEDALRELLHAHRMRGDAGEVLTTIGRLIHLEEDDEAKAMLYLESARALIAVDGHVDQILEDYATAVRLDPLLEDARIELEQYCRQEQRLHLLAAVLAEVPPTVEILDQLARTLESTNDLEELCSIKARLVEMASGPIERADRMYEHGRLLEATKQKAAAMGRYLQIIEQVPGHQPALKAVQRIYRADGKTAALILVLEQELDVVVDEDRRVEILLDLARANEEMVQPARALDRLEEAHTVQPHKHEARRSLERLYDPDHPLELARVLRLHSSLDPDSPESVDRNLRAGALYLEYNQLDEAEEALRLAHEQDPGNREVFIRYEGFLTELERWHGLLALYSKMAELVEQGGDSSFRLVDLFSRRGKLQLERLGQPGEAAASYLQALEHDPKSEAVMKVLEGLFVQQQDWLGLIRAHEHRAGLIPDNELFRLESLRQAARICTSRLPDQVQEAKRLWQEIYRVDPIDGEAINNLVRIHEEAGDYPELADLLDIRVALTSDEELTVRIRLHLAEVCELHLEDHERAAAAYEGVIVLLPHHEETLQALARIYEATGNWTRCLEVLRGLVLIEADPVERAMHYFKCGSILETHFGDDDKAIESYSAALNETPGCLPAIHGIRDLYLRREEWNHALDSLEQELRLWEEPREQAGVMARMGEVRLQYLKDTRKAMEHFEDALAIDPECHPASAALFNLYFERGDYHKALSIANGIAGRMAKEGPLEQRSDFFSRQGQMLASVGQMDEAAGNLVRALELWPMNLKALDWLIALCRRSPDAFDFATTFRELEQIYRREGDQAAVGHVLVAAGALSEGVGDADTALARYQEAIQTAPEDFAPVKSLADLLVRLRQQDDAIYELRQFIDHAPDDSVKVKAKLRLAELYSNIVMDSDRAAEIYREILSAESDNAGAAEGLAQEQFLAGEVDQAVATMAALVKRVIEDGAARPAELSRYTCYLGVLLGQKGDREAAMEQLRRAIQIDVLNVEAPIFLSRHLVETGERAAAQHLLGKTIQILTQRSRHGRSLELRRCLAALCRGGGDREAAIVHLEAMVQETGRVEDQLALAEVYAEQEGGVTRAIRGLEQVLEQDTFCRPVLEMLATLHERQNGHEMALQVMQVMALMADDEAEGMKLQGMRRTFSHNPAGILGNEMWAHLSRPAEENPQVARLWQTLSVPLEQLFALELDPHTSVSADQIDHPFLKKLISSSSRMMGMEVTVILAEEVPGGVVPVGGDGDQIIIDKVLLTRPMAELAFAIGRSFGYLYSGHALLSRLATDDRLLLGELIVGLLQPREDYNDLVLEFRRGLSRRIVKQLDEVLSENTFRQGGSITLEAPSRWAGQVDLLANQIGMLTCDDIGASLRMMAQLGRQEVSLGPQREVVPRLVPDGPELVQFFLSKEYLLLRHSLFDQEGS